MLRPQYILKNMKETNCSEIGPTKLFIELCLCTSQNNLYSLMFTIVYTVVIMTCEIFSQTCFV